MNQKNQSGTIDYSAYLDQEQSKSQLERLAVLAEAQRRLEHEVEQAEQLLEKKKAELQHMSESTLPEAMEQLGLETFRTRSGLTITVDVKLYAAISEQNKPMAFKWLDMNGYSKLIKRIFTVRFGKGDEAWAKKFARDLRQRKRLLDVEEKKEVHAQTLKAFVKELMTEGKEFPSELFGVHRQQYTKVELPK